MEVRTGDDNRRKLLQVIDSDRHKSKKQKANELYRQFSQCFHLPPRAYMTVEVLNKCLHAIQDDIESNFNKKPLAQYWLPALTDANILKTEEHQNKRKMWTLRYENTLCYETLYYLIQAQTQKCLPFKTTQLPREYIDDLLWITDPDDKLELRCPSWIDPRRIGEILGKQTYLNSLLPIKFDQETSAHMMFIKNTLSNTCDILQGDKNKGQVSLKNFMQKLTNKTNKLIKYSNNLTNLKYNYHSTTEKMRQTMGSLKMSLVENQTMNIELADILSDIEKYIKCSDFNSQNKARPSMDKIQKQIIPDFTINSKKKIPKGLWAIKLEDLLMEEDFELEGFKKEINYMSENYPAITSARVKQVILEGILNGLPLGQKLFGLYHEKSFDFNNVLGPKLMFYVEGIMSKHDLTKKINETSQTEMELELSACSPNLPISNFHSRYPIF